MKEYDLDTFRKQLETMKQMGSMRDLLGRITGLSHAGMENLAGVDADEEVKQPSRG